MLDTHKLAGYLQAYVRAYRQRYERLVAQPPRGGGYPPLAISPYLYSSRLTCYLTTDGVAIADFSWEPPYAWHIAGGPAMMVDLPESRTPQWVNDAVREAGILGESIGIYRMVAKDGIPPEVWRGDLPAPTQSAKLELEGGGEIQLSAFNVDLRTLLERLTFGAFGRILDIKLPQVVSEFWHPHVVRDMGFLTADRQFKRFFHYLEMHPYVEDAAWDTRTLWTRARVDVLRDFADAMALGGRPGGILSLGPREDAIVPAFFDKLSLLEQAIEGFERLLIAHSGEDEAVFHDYLRRNPVLIDVYGILRSKPRFQYPPGESPLGKKYVEPDFIAVYPNWRYKLIELERPGDILATKAGQPREKVTQATFQTAEWKTFIQNHYDLIKNEYPGISTNCTTAVVISRRSQAGLGRDGDLRSYLELMRNQFSVDEFLLYDDLLSMAKQAYIRLSTLTPQVPPRQ